MTLIFCVDDHFGVMFNNRRQSRDIAVLEDIKKCHENQTIYVRPYSEKLFKDNDIPYSINNGYKSNDGVYFIENTCPPDLFDKADEIIIYHWGRLYPADKQLDFRFISKNFDLKNTSVFPGNSHEKIKKEIYIRRK